MSSPGIISHLNVIPRYHLSLECHPQVSLVTYSHLYSHLLILLKDSNCIDRMLMFECPLQVSLVTYSHLYSHPLSVVTCIVSYKYCGKIATEQIECSCQNVIPRYHQSLSYSHLCSHLQSVVTYRHLQSLIVIYSQKGGGAAVSLARLFLNR